MRRVVLLFLTCLLGCNTNPDKSGGGDPAATDSGGQSGTTDDDLPADAFMVVVLPDTQIYAQSFPETFDAQLRWIAEHKEEHNIVFVTHVGDIVQAANRPDEWTNATAAYQWIRDIDLPHGFSVGGHDVSNYGETPNNTCANFSHIDCDFTDFLEHFGPQHYEGSSWWGGASESGHSSFQTVSASGLNLLFLHLPQDTPRPEVEWANEVIDAHPGHLVHITTHRYLFDYRLTEDLPTPLNLIPAGRFNALTYTLGGQSLLWTDGLEAEQLFEELVSAHPNVWGVHCGHVDAEFKQTSQNVAGLPIHEILVDYQDMEGGGNGWMRLLTFSPSSNEIRVQSYSPVLDAYRANGDGFDHAIDILEAYRSAAEDVLESFGLEAEEVDALLDAIKTEGSPEREQYYESLYGAGDRDSDFVLSVDFAAYIDAAR